MSQCPGDVCSCRTKLSNGKQKAISLICTPNGMVCATNIRIWYKNPLDIKKLVRHQSGLTFWIFSRNVGAQERSGTTDRIWIWITKNECCALWGTESAAGHRVEFYPCWGLRENVEIFLALSQHPACHMHFTIACQLKSVSGLSSWSFAGERWGFPGVPGKHTLRYHNWESAGEMNCLRAIIIWEAF